MRPSSSRRLPKRALRSSLLFVIAALALGAAAGGPSGARAGTRPPSPLGLRAITNPAAGVTGSVLYEFKSDVNGCKGGDGAEPDSGLVGDASGALYGVTPTGDATCPKIATEYGFGTVYKLIPSGGKYAETILHSFLSGTDGAGPNGPLVIDGTGALYGTTGGGGIDCPATGGTSGCGTVFKLTPSGSGYLYTILYSFGGGTDGASPSGGLVADKSGSLYGITSAGGSICTIFGSKVTTGCGTVFKITRSGTAYKESIIYRFAGGPSGGFIPQGPLTFDGKGALYGTTYWGGSGSCTVSGFKYGCGTVFKLTPTGSSLSESAYSFPNATAGFEPQWGVIIDGSGSLYGTTAAGGSAGAGTVFKLMPTGSGYTERVVHSFTGSKADGANPHGGLLAIAGGSFYGTTFAGGPNNTGVLFEILASGSSYTEKLVFGFGFAPNSADPAGSLIADKSGALYGATSDGGLTSGNCLIFGGCGGTVFKIIP